MKVLLLHPPIQVNQDHIDYPAFTSLALWHNAAFLKHHGFDVRVLDSFSLSTSQKTENKPYFYLGPEKQEFIRELSKEQFDVVIVHLDQFLVQFPEPKFISSIITALKRLSKDAPVILADMHIGGMNYVAYDPARFLDDSCRPDWLVRFESELGLLNLLEAISENTTKQFDPSAPIESPLLPGPLSTYNDTLYEMVDINLFLDFIGRYTASDTRANPFNVNANTIAFKSSRGCCYSCYFCTSNPSSQAGMRGKWRALLPKEMESQLKKLSQNKKVKKLFILDEAANVDQGHFISLLEISEKCGFELEFPNGLRADKLTRNTVEMLKDRISILSLSPESGSKTVLSSVIGKRQTLNEVEKATMWASENNIPVALHFMIGIPGEKRKDTAKTFAFATKMYETYGAQPWIQFAVPIPGTAMFEEAQKMNMLPDTLPVDYNPLFQGTPMLKNGAADIPNGEMKRLKKALENKVRNKQES